MLDPVTTTIGLALASFLWELPKQIAFEVIGGEAHRRSLDIAERLRQRLLTGRLPTNEPIEQALRNALAGATLVFAYTFHDPDRKLLGALVVDDSWSLSRARHRVSEFLRNNIRQEQPGDVWLSEVIRLANDPASFATFDVDIVLAGDRPWHLVGQQFDATLRAHVHRQFLQWLPVGRSAFSPTPDKPPDFDRCVTEGLTFEDGKTLTFYDVFRLFFRQELQERPLLHRAYVADVLTDLKADVDQVLASLPSDQERQQLRAAIDAWATFDTFRAQMAQQNRELLEETRSLLAHVNLRIDYAIAGLPIRRFELPDPPERELDVLQAQYRTVKLTGRDADLDALWRWLFSAERISARLIVGGAGTGKTRLALELLLRVDDRLRHWQAGLLDPDVLRRFDATKQPADWRWPAPTLLVVDYAQALARPLASLLRALTHKRRDTSLPALRILLLERQAGDWVDTLMRARDNGGPCTVGRLFNPATPQHLTPLPQGDLRHHVFAQTLAAAARLTGKPSPALPPAGHPDYDAAFARDLFEEPLNLMLAALAASEHGVLPALRRERIDLALEIAGKEIRRIKRFVRKIGNEAQERLLCHLAACATLERGFTADELDRAVLEELAALKLTWPDGEGDLAEVLCRTLPSGHLPVMPIAPDFIGEAVVLSVLAQPTASGGPERWRTWCRVVERCCSRDARSTPVTLLHAFQNFGQHPLCGEALLAATDALIQIGLAQAEPDILVGIERALPDDTVELLTRAADVTYHLYTRLKADLNSGREDVKPEVARIAMNLGVRLLNLGRQAEALEPAQEAVALYRALATQHPDASQPALANSLNNLAILLGALGRRAEALEPAQEAVAICRALATQHPDAFRPDLAMSLNNLAIRLGELGRWPEALEPAQEGVAIRRALAPQHPDAFRPHLALALNNVAILLNELGRRREALEPAQEAVSIYRALATQNADAFRPYLSGSLNNLANHLSGLGQWADALEPAQESVAIYRALAAQHPEAFRPDLARSLGMIGRVLEGNEQLVAAWESYHAGAKILATDFRPDLAAFASLMTNLVKHYLRLAATLDREPDEDLLQSVREIQSSLSQPTADGDSRNAERQD